MLKNLAKTLSAALVAMALLVGGAALVPTDAAAGAHKGGATLHLAHHRGHRKHYRKRYFPYHRHYKHNYYKHRYWYYWHRCRKWIYGKWRYGWCVKRR